MGKAWQVVYEIACCIYFLIFLTGGIPFAVTLPKAPDTINSDMMTTREIHAKLQKGYDDIEAGNVQNAMGQYNRIADEILKLDVFPERFRIMYLHLLLVFEPIR